MKQNYPLPIIALDLAARSGYAHSAGPRGVWTIRNVTDGHALADMLERILNLAVAYGAGTVAAEAPFFHPKHPTGSIIKIQHGATAKIAAARVGAMYLEYAPSQIKLLTAGKGNASKAEMIAAVNSIYKIQTSDDNEADAVALLGIVRDGISPATKNKK